MKEGGSGGEGKGHGRGRKLGEEDGKGRRTPKACHPPQPTVSTIDTAGGVTASSSLAAIYCTVTVTTNHCVSTSNYKV